MRKFEELEIWQKARIIVNEISKLMENYRDYGFKDQIQRASVSIMNNIAEGSEAGSDAIFVRYLNIAKGSCAEVRSMLYLCEDKKLCSAEYANNLREILIIIASKIKKLINYLRPIS